MALPLTNVIGLYKAEGATQQPDRRVTRYIVIHHAAWTYAPGAALKSIFTYHSSKWPKYGRIGYHEVIQEERNHALVCYQVNPPNMQCANVANRNHECFGICAATNFTGAPSDMWLNALAERAAAAKRIWPDAQIVGHTDVALKGFETTCPGPRWKEWRPTLLNRIQALLIEVPPPRPLTQKYRLRVDQAVFTARNPAAPLAAVNDVTVIHERGKVITLGDITDGWGWDASQIGFLPMAVLEGPLP